MRNYIVVKYKPMLLRSETAVVWVRKPPRYLGRCFRALCLGPRGVGYANRS